MAKPVAEDPRQAFLEGYKAYRARDLEFAAASLSFAADRAPPLADYALYFLGSAERDLGREVEAEAAMRRLVGIYPQSVFAERGNLELGELELKAGRAGEASASASRVVGRTGDPEVEQDARLLLARALLASNDARGAYEQLEVLRNKHPRSRADSDARALERALLAAHPEIVNTDTIEYHRVEGELLLKEGLASEALAQVDAALTRSPPPALRAELLWLEARTVHSNPPRAKRALTDYLALAPTGPDAPAALDKLARVYWNEDDTARARIFFRRLVREFPSSRLAPDAMFAIGRTFEDEGKFKKARSQYDRLYARYPSSEAALEARFRAAFTCYMSGEYRNAAWRFGATAERIGPGAERDMFFYWNARALERSGAVERAHSIFHRLALSIESNYYPALASRRVGVRPAFFPAALEPGFAPQAPPTLAGDAGFHLTRTLALRALELRELEPAELKALEGYTPSVPALRGFVLVGYREAGAWYGAIEAATRMVKRDEIGTETAERFRYPRGYWDLIAPVAELKRLDPYLLLSLTRQESLFNPQARSSADARGLMQLLPVTAHRVARSSDPDRLDLYNPATSVELGTSYLRLLLDMFRGDEFKAIAAYNAGEHAVRNWSVKFPGDDDQWVENIGYRETREYVKKVIGGLREYQLLYQSQPDGSPSRPAPSSPG